MKETAAVSALFIFVNSLADLAEIFTTGFEYKPEIVWMIALAFLAGLTGSYLGAKKFDSTFLKRLLAVVLLMASVKLLFA